MPAPAVLRLRKGEERRARAGHLWIYSNEIDTGATPFGDLEPGSPVEVRSSRGDLVGFGYANPHSLIAVRLLTREPGPFDEEALIAARLASALSLRERLFPGEPFYRLAFGEGDGLPGLVVDRFGDVLAVQPTTAGIERLLPLIVSTLTELTGAGTVVVRADSPVRRSENLPTYVDVARGQASAPVPLRENGVRFETDVLAGQKTGWFYDHRPNRERMRRYVAGARVLDAFAYVGAWGVQSAVFGAREVVCVDSSSPALEQARVNAGMNGVHERIHTVRGDAFEVLRDLRDGGERFDVVILDPPAFIKRRKDIAEGEQAYRRLNRLALDLLPVGGVLVSASCSFHLTREALLRAILWAGTKAGRDLQILEEGHQGPDHPIHPAIPETAYLKLFVARVMS